MNSALSLKREQRRLHLVEILQACPVAKFNASSADGRTAASDERVYTCKSSLLLAIAYRMRKCATCVRGPCATRVRE
eukprot:3653715-Pleurochrysis_carterae.AAC.2